MDNTGELETKGTFSDTSGEASLLLSLLAAGDAIALIGVLFFLMFELSSVCSVLTVSDSTGPAAESVCSSFERSINND